jgi:catechol 2,3-dioxygenase
LRTGALNPFNHDGTSASALTLSQTGGLFKEESIKLGRASIRRRRSASVERKREMKPIHPDVQIGHVHLKVSDLERAIAFYRDVLGFELTQRYGRQAAFLSAGGYHHHIGLNTWESRGGSAPQPGATGLYHLAILYPTRAELADALRRLLKASIPLEGASDHGVSEALYLRDADGNGVELYWDRPKEQWPRTPDGGVNMVTQPLDIEALLKEGDNSSRVPA